MAFFIFGELGDLTPSARDCLIDPRPPLLEQSGENGNPSTIQSLKFCCHIAQKQINIRL